MASVTATHLSPNQTQPEASRWLTKAWLEPRLVVVTALAIVASALAERLNASAGVILIFNIVSYIAGGLFGVKTALERDRKSVV